MEIEDQTKKVIYLPNYLKQMITFNIGVAYYVYYRKQCMCK